MARSRPHAAGRGGASAAVKRRNASGWRNCTVSHATPTAIATSEAMAAPATPNAAPVPQPKIRIGARTMLMATVTTWTIIGVRNAPEPRRAAAIVASTNCSASAGMNHTQVAVGEPRRRRVGGERPDVEAPAGHRDDQEQRRRSRGEPLRLVEDVAGARAVPGAGRVRDQRGRADAQHLRAGQHDERQVAGDADGGDRFLAEAADPVEIDQEVQRLRQHRDQHEAGRAQQVPRQRSGGEVFHRAIVAAAAR